VPKKIRITFQDIETGSRAVNWYIGLTKSAQAGIDLDNEVWHAEHRRK
jgi:hypothetical protein